MQPHYAGAVPLPVLKREQDRILAELDTTNRRIDAHHGDYADARAHLDDALNLLVNHPGVSGDSLCCELCWLQG